MLGLYGHDGILPIRNALDGSGQNPLLLFFSYPSVFWFNSSDAFLSTVPAIGAVVSFLAMLGILCGPCLLIAWFLYLSIVAGGQEFMSFQWDILLCETGFLSLFLAPWRPFDFLFNLIGNRFNHPSWMIDRTEPPLIIIWLLRWLLFRLMLQSGLVKLDSMDPTWRDLTAMTYHYETQPLPTPIGWFAHHLPVPFQIFSTGSVFFFELIVPFLIFCGKNARLIAAVGLAFLQFLILLTGNYCFFNWLTLALCLLLLDDSILLRTIDGRLRSKIEAIANPETSRLVSRLRLAAVAPVAVLIIFLSTIRPICGALGLLRLPDAPLMVVALCSPWHLVSSYGLFAVMTTSRPEIAIEGSADGKLWKPYVFKFKPGPLDHPPPVVAPYQPRLDWQMWFAALGSVAENPWLVSFSHRLLQNSPAVVALLETNPFPHTPPKYIRAIVYDYHMSDVHTMMKTGKWWKREFKEVYMPAITLDDAREF
jgi:uncharacterized membrane protein YphA (DoxX/SURF4 family)